MFLSGSCENGLVGLDGKWEEAGLKEPDEAFVSTPVTLPCKNNPNGKGGGQRERL